LLIISYTYEAIKIIAPIPKIHVEIEAAIELASAITAIV
jgi:hypothetical protein